MDPDRVEMYYNSSAMGPQFAQSCRDFTERIRKLGIGVEPQEVFERVGQASPWR